MAWFPTDPRSVTAGWLSEVLGGDVRECSFEQIGIGVGILGRVYRVHLIGTGVPASVVVKLPTLDEGGAAFCEDMALYQREVRFYQQVGLANPLPPARPYFAALDPATDDFILVLEDLGRLRVDDQLVGCPPADAGVVVDAIAAHHAHWWASDRFTSMAWLRSFKDPPYPDVIAANFAASWPAVLDRFGDHLSGSMRAFGERFPSMVNWYASEITRPPVTFLHGDLRLDQLFFAVDRGDPPVTALDWQISTQGRGAHDLAYFLSQSLTTESRRACEAGLIERYADRLAELGIGYDGAALDRDYRLSIAWCFAYPVLGTGRFQVASDRQEELLRTMLTGAVAAIEDHDALALRPD